MIMKTNAMKIQIYEVRVKGPVAHQEAPLVSQYPPTLSTLAKLDCEANHPLKAPSSFSDSGWDWQYS
jgi:hypothetical protein